MHSYAIFTARKGRPKVTKSYQVQKKSSDLEVILSLFYLKKLNHQQIEAAKYYESVCRRYYSSIDCPAIHSASVLGVERGKSFRHPDRNDEAISREWNSIKTELNKVDKLCENLLYKTIIENQFKYELLNPVNAVVNLLKILQLGLDQINEYRLKSSIRIKLE